MTIKARLENLERQHKTNPDDGDVWLAWCDDSFATCGAETKPLVQLANEGSRMITLTWGDE